GMVMTNDESLYRRLLRLRFYGMEKTYYSKEHGYNSRLDEIHAAVLLWKLGRVDEYISSRRSIARQYDQLLSDTSLLLPKTRTENTHVYYQYVCRHHKRDEIIRELKARDICINICYPWPIHTMTGYQYLGYKAGDLPHTEKAAGEIFSLPVYPSLTESEQQSVIAALHEILPMID
ncbi:MAG: DegT/DnrJ/EryC1/StrS family aminotransferase, partial [Thermodesulfovibrionales bacterium]